MHRPSVCLCSLNLALVHNKTLSWGDLLSAQIHVNFSFPPFFSQVAMESWRARMGPRQVCWGCFWDLTVDVKLGWFQQAICCEVCDTLTANVCYVTMTRRGQETRWQGLPRGDPALLCRDPSRFHTTIVTQQYCSGGSDWQVRNFKLETSDLPLFCYYKPHL